MISSCRDFSRIRVASQMRLLQVPGGRGGEDVPAADSGVGTAALHRVQGQWQARSVPAWSNVRHLRVGSRPARGRKKQSCRGLMVMCQNWLFIQHIFADERHACCTRIGRHAGSVAFRNDFRLGLICGCVFLLALILLLPCLLLAETYPNAVQACTSSTAKMLHLT